jgi:hypothetical protein
MMYSLPEATRAQRHATRADASLHDEVATILEAQADHARELVPEGAERKDGLARQHRRSAWMIRRHVNARRSTRFSFCRTAPRARGAGRPARRTTRTSRGSPDDDPGEPEPPAAGGFRLNLVDRAPLLWRVRAARCRLHELLEGVAA